MDSRGRVLRKIEHVQHSASTSWKKSKKKKSKHRHSYSSDEQEAFSDTDHHAERSHRRHHRHLSSSEMHEELDDTHDAHSHHHSSKKRMKSFKEHSHRKKRHKHRSLTASHRDDDDDALQSGGLEGLQHNLVLESRSDSVSSSSQHKKHMRVSLKEKGTREEVIEESIDDAPTTAESKGADNMFKTEPKVASSCSDALPSSKEGQSVISTSFLAEEAPDLAIASDSAALDQRLSPIHASSSIGNTVRYRHKQEVCGHSDGGDAVAAERPVTGRIKQEPEFVSGGLVEDDSNVLKLETVVSNLEKQRRDRLEKFKAIASTKKTEESAEPFLSPPPMNSDTGIVAVTSMNAKDACSAASVPAVEEAALNEATYPPSTSNISPAPLSTNKSDRLDRFHAFAASKMAQSNASKLQVVADMASDTVQEPKVGGETKSNLNARAKMKLKLVPNAVAPLNKFTNASRAERQRGIDVLASTVDRKDSPNATDMGLSTLEDSPVEESDPLDMFMMQLQQEMDPSLLGAEIQESADMVIDLPKAITLEEIQGWNLHKFKWDRSDHRGYNFASSGSTIDYSDSDDVLGSGETSTAAVHLQGDEVLPSSCGDNTLKISEHNFVENDAYYEQFLRQMRFQSAYFEGSSNGVLTDAADNGCLTTAKGEVGSEANAATSATDTPFSKNIADYAHSYKTVSGHTNVSTNDEQNEIDVDEERLFSDDEAPTRREQDSNTETYFDLVKKVGQKKELPPIDHSAIKYMKFRKNLYIQVREITLMKDHEVEALRKTHGNIKVRGKNCPRPITSFYQCGLLDRVVKLIQKREYFEPFPIQMQAIPALMSGRDVIGIAETGSGKTVAYVLPLLRHVLDQPALRDGDGPIALVIAPTRELALQIYQEVNKFCKATQLRCVAVYGGTGIGEQLGLLRRGAEVVVGTPGRLIDVLTISNGKVTNLQRVTFLVLDEADRMFDMGFEPQISAIVRNIQPESQRCLFSATFPAHIEALARKILYKPIEIIVGEKGRSASKIKQYVEVRTEQDKFYRLLQLLGEWNEHGSIVIFVSRQIEADELFGELLKYGYQCAVLHGGQDQTDREFTIQDFKEGIKTILIATSVAARGLDVKAVVLVINYKAPDHLEDYVHRIGRTGRAGNVGVAYTFITAQEGDKAEDFVKALKQSNQPIPAELQQLADTFKVQCNLRIAIAHKNKGFGGRGFKFTSSEKSRLQVERQAAKKELGMDEEEEEEEALPISSLDTEGVGEDLGGVPLIAAGISPLTGMIGNAQGGLALGEAPPPSSGVPPLPSVGTNPPLLQAAASYAVPTTSADAVSGAAARAKALADMIRKQDAERHLGVVQPPPPPTPPPGMTSSAALGDTQNAAALSQTALSIENQADAMARNIVAHVQDPAHREIQFQQTKQSIKESLSKLRNPSASGSGMSQSLSDQTIELLKQGGGAGTVPLANAQMLSKAIGKHPLLQGEAGSNFPIIPSGLAQVPPTLGKIPGLSAQAYIDPNTGNYVDELDINDYPQQARFKITHKEVLSQISEETSAICQIKGQYVPPEQARSLLPGMKRLYVEIVGGTPISVQRAKHELRILMESVSMRQLNITSSQRPIGRYSVL